jgi:hypothetical protein
MAQTSRPKSVRRKLYSSLVQAHTTREPCVYHNPPPEILTNGFLSKVPGDIQAVKGTHARDFKVRFSQFFGIIQ